MLGRWCWWRDDLPLRLLLKWAAVSESAWQLKWVMAICKLSWHVCWSKTALSLTMTALTSLNTVNTFNLVWSILKNKFMMVGETRWCCVGLDISVVAQDSLHHLFSQEHKKSEEKSAEKVLTAKQGKKSSGLRDGSTNVKKIPLRKEETLETVQRSVIKAVGRSPAARRRPKFTGFERPFA